MKKIQNIFFIILGISIIIGMFVAIIYSIKFFINFFYQIDATVAAALIAASGTIIATTFTVVIGQNINKRREIEEAHRSYKIDIYSKFIDFTIDYVFSQNRNDVEPISDEELQKFFIKFSKDLTLWASPEVIKTWSIFRSQAGDDSNSDTLSKVDNIYRAMRKDLGNSNAGLNNRALINLYVND